MFCYGESHQFRWRAWQVLSKIETLMGYYYRSSSVNATIMVSKDSVLNWLSRCYHFCDRMTDIIAMVWPANKTPVISAVTTHNSNMNSAIAQGNNQLVLIEPPGLIKVMSPESETTGCQHFPTQYMHTLQNVNHERLLSSLNFAVIVQTVESKCRNQDSYLHRYTFIKLPQNLSLRSVGTCVQCCLFLVDWISMTRTPTNFS